MALKRQRNEDNPHHPFGSPSSKKVRKSISITPSPQDRNVCNNNNNNNNDSILYDNNDDILSDKTNSSSNNINIKDTMNTLKINSNDNSNDDVILTPKLRLKQSICPSTNEDDMDSHSNGNNDDISDTTPNRNERRSMNCENEYNSKLGLILNDNYLSYSELNYIISLPPNDLCDRYLVIISHNNSNEYNDINNENNNIEEIKVESLEEYNINNEYDNILLKLDKESKKLIDSLKPDTYKIIRVSNFALGLKSEMFRKLLSKNSNFMESNEYLVPIRIEVEYRNVFELLIRLLHVLDKDIFIHLKRVCNIKILIKLLMLCDQYNIISLVEPILHRIKVISMRDRPIMSSSFYNTSPSIYTTPSSKIINEMPLSQPISSKTVSKSKTPSKGSSSSKAKSLEGSYQELFGISILELSELLLLPDHIQCLRKVKQIIKNSICKRYTELKFDDKGYVDEIFLNLPKEGINLILGSNNFRCYSENDVFLACVQWTTNNKYSGRLLSDVCDNINYHCMDDWYITQIIQNYMLYASNKPEHKLPKNIQYKILKCISLFNFCGKITPRIHDVELFFENESQPRSIPHFLSIGNNNYDKYSNYLENNNVIYWNDFVNRKLTNEMINSIIDNYNTFHIRFNYNDIVGLNSDERITSSYMVWKGITFALDLVRKQNDDSNDTVGIFLYSHGIINLDNHIFVKYSLKTLNNQNQLQCSEFKKMQLNFTRYIDTYKHNILYIYHTYKQR